MDERVHALAFVVATKDRPEELRRLLASLDGQSHKPDQVIVVDGGDRLTRDVVGEFPRLRTAYVRSIPPSAARQRNEGLDAVAREISLIGFLDDDVVLEPDAIESMLDFWRDAPEKLGGASFNMANHPAPVAAGLKSLFVIRRAGFYAGEPGSVSTSGFQTMIGFLAESRRVAWLPSGAVVWRRCVLDEVRFDEWFSGYSYLEDLDFSYRVGKFFDLAVAPKALYRHYPAPLGRGSGRVFGTREVLNRIYFVRKYPELSLWRCYLTLMLRMLMSLSSGISGLRKNDLERVWGNIMGLISSLRRA
jgi:GT2 family glycosyltransferase